MVTNVRLSLVLCGLLFFGVVTEGLGQQFTGNIRGSVRDSDGIIPGVTVALINEATSVSRDTITNASGEYNFPAIPPATYTIRASIVGLQGLRAARRPYRDPAVRNHRPVDGGRDGYRVGDGHG